MTSKSRMIRKIARNAFQGLFFLASCLLLPASSSAQSPVNVTATVKDSAGIPYSNATVSILLIPTGTAPTVGGAQINGTNNGQLDVNGKLNVSLYKNTDIVPASSQWQFTICETPGVAPPLGTGGQCFTSSQTVSAAVDFSTQFQAAAKALSTVTLGAGSVTHTGGALTANLPVIGAGGADIAVGTRTGNTTVYPTFTGAATAARCVDTDASGNLQVVSADCNSAAFGPNYSLGGGTAQAQTVAPTTAVTNATLVDGYVLIWSPLAPNSGSAPTLAGSGTSTFSAHPIVKYGGAALIANDIITTTDAVAIYNLATTSFILQNPQAGILAGTSVAVTGAATNCQNLFASGQYPSGFFSGHCSPPVLAQSNQWIDPLADGLPGDAMTTDGSYNLGWGVQRRTLTGTAYTNATTTFSNVVGSAGQTLQFTVVASAKYKISCDIEWQGSAGTTGPKWQWTGPASPTALVQWAHNPVTTSTYLDAVGSKTAFSSPMADTGTITAATDFVSHLDLELVNGVNSGTVVLQAAANGVGTLTIQPGSSCVSNGDK